MTTLHTNIGLRGGAFDPPEVTSAGRSQPVPVLPLTYSDGREPLFPLIRIGGVIGFLAFALTALALPIWTLSGHVSDEYEKNVHMIMPVLQLVSAGAGLSLVIAGRVISRRRARFGMLLALSLNLVAIWMSQVEMHREVHPRAWVRWTMITSTGV